MNFLEDFIESKRPPNARYAQQGLTPMWIEKHKQAKNLYQRLTKVMRSNAERLGDDEDAIRALWAETEEYMRQGGS